EALVEFVDMYPSLCEACGLSVPEHCEGTSFVPLLKDPGRQWKSAAFSQYPRREAMGYAMRTDRYRYVEWRDRKSGAVLGREVYDHQAEPQENTNVLGASGSEHAELVAELSAKLVREWPKARLPATAAAGT